MLTRHPLMVGADAPQMATSRRSPRCAVGARLVTSRLRRTTTAQQDQSARQTRIDCFVWLGYSIPVALTTKAGPTALEETRRVGRVLRIAHLISTQPRAWTQQRLAQKFEVSERMLIRRATTSLVGPWCSRSPYRFPRCWRWPPSHRSKHAPRGLLTVVPSREPWRTSKTRYPAPLSRTSAEWAPKRLSQRSRRCAQWVARSRRSSRVYRNDICRHGTGPWWARPVPGRHVGIPQSQHLWCDGLLPSTM